jgi:hypothetical protein
MTAHLLACQQAGNGHTLPGIFPGLFTRNKHGENSPTQNVYSIISVSLLIEPLWNLILNNGGLNE